MGGKDYILIANAIKRFREDSKDDEYVDFLESACNVIVENIADALKTDNPNFDKQRFIEACK